MAWHPAERAQQPHRLRKLSRMTPEPEPETDDLCLGSLLEDALHTSTVLLEPGGDGKKEGSAPRDRDSATRDLEAVLGESLQPPNGKYTR